MLKLFLRKSYNTQRLNIVADERNLTIKNILFELNQSNFLNQIVSIYLPIKHKNEIDTTEIIALIKSKGGSVVVPKANFQTMEMKHYRLNDHLLLETNKFGIPEPKNGELVPNNLINAVIIPLLIFDCFGHRVGYGKGFYDQFLAECNPSVLKIGLCDFSPVEKITDLLSTDIALDLCITPTKLYTFQKDA